MYGGHIPGLGGWPRLVLLSSTGDGLAKPGPEWLPVWITCIS